MAMKTSAAIKGNLGSRYLQDSATLAAFRCQTMVTVKMFATVDFAIFMKYNSLGLVTTLRVESVPANIQCTVRHRLNSSPPGQNGRHLADDTFRCDFRE